MRTIPLDEISDEEYSRGWFKGRMNSQRRKLIIDKNALDVRPGLLQIIEKANHAQKEYIKRTSVQTLGRSCNR